MIKLFKIVNKVKFIMTVVFVLFSVHTGFSQNEKDDKINRLEKKVKTLTERIDQLMNKLEAKTKNDTTEKEASLKELETALATNGNGEQSQQSQISSQTMDAKRQFFQGMNPNISVIGTFSGTATDQDHVERNLNIGLDETEFAFQAIVDPYARADFYVAFGRHEEGLLAHEEDEHEEEEHAEEGGHGHGAEEGGLATELEEAYLTLLNLPNSMQLKVGKFRPKFGKLNETHPHAYNILSMPLMYLNFMGGEGLVDEGTQLNWLLPNSSFFQELSLDILNGPSESPSFVKANTDNFLYMAHLKNYFDLSDNTSLELGLGALSGPYNEVGDRSTIFSTDLTLKWKPLQFNRYKSFEWQTEALLSRRDSHDGTIESFGLFTHLRYQIAKRWFLGYLYDYSEFPQSSELHQNAHSGILQFLATEFQKFEIQGRYNKGNFIEDFFDVKLRAVFVIGSHGAHQY